MMLSITQEEIDLLEKFFTTADKVLLDNNMWRCGDTPYDWIFTVEAEIKNPEWDKILEFAKWVWKCGFHLYVCNCENTAYLKSIDEEDIAYVGDDMYMMGFPIAFVGKCLEIFDVVDFDIWIQKKLEYCYGNAICGTGCTVNIGPNEKKIYIDSIIAEDIMTQTEKILEALKKKGWKTEVCQNES